MKTTNLDWRYIAGFFDGEGSVMKNKSGWRISIPQTHRGVLESIQSTSHVGSVIHISRRQVHWRESWTFSVSRQRDVNTFLKKVQPYLVVKRAIVRTVLHQLPNILFHQQERRRLTLTRRRSIGKLRRQGYSYRAIGQKLGLDFGHVRRVFLRSIR